MTAMTETTPPQTAEDTDVVSAVQQILAASDEPVTLPKIRSQLPARFRSASLEELAKMLHRQVAANVLVAYPKYRSQHDRFWDRPMQVHVVSLVRGVLREGPLGWSELRRKLPAYAVTHAESVVNEQVAQGQLHRHPAAGKRGGERFGLETPHPRHYLRQELTEVFRRLSQMGFTLTQLREGALELLHEEEWSLEPPEAPAQEARTEDGGDSPAEPSPAPTAGAAAPGPVGSLFPSSSQPLAGPHEATVPEGVHSQRG